MVTLSSWVFWPHCGRLSLSSCEKCVSQEDGAGAFHRVLLELRPREQLFVIVIVQLNDG